MDISITKRKADGDLMPAKNEPIDKIVEYTGLRKASVEKLKWEMGK